MADPAIKTCSKCHKSKEVCEFSARSDQPGKFFSHCKKCRRIQYKKAGYSEKRKKKYNSDEEYRKKVQARNRLYHRTDSKKRNAAARLLHQDKRKEVIDKYGGECACCSISDYEFLAIDHVMGGGYEHRKTVGSAQLVRDLLSKDNIDPDYRLLCHNCNSSFGYYGYCPHKG